MKVLLDTNAYSAMRRGHPGVAAAIRDADAVLFSVVVVGELLHGFRRGSREQLNRKQLDEFLAEEQVTLLPVTRDTAERFAHIAASLAGQGTPIPTNDIWIAAHAFEHAAHLITFDAHFGRVPGLLWSAPEGA